MKKKVRKRWPTTVYKIQKQMMKERERENEASYPAVFVVCWLGGLLASCLLVLWCC
jgi:hypothetical protein